MPRGYVHFKVGENLESIAGVGYSVARLFPVAAGSVRPILIDMRCILKVAPARTTWREDPAMKSDIHPDYHMIKVVMTNGTEYMTRSTYGEEGAELRLDIDPSTHPAWTGGQQTLLDRGGRVSRFKNKYSGIFGN